MKVGGSLRASQAASLECDRGTRGIWGASWGAPGRRGREGKMMDVAQYVDDNAAEFFGALAAIAAELTAAR